MSEFSGLLSPTCTLSCDISQCMLGYALDNICLMTAWTITKELQHLMGKARKKVAGKGFASVCFVLS